MRRTFTRETFDQPADLETKTWMKNVFDWKNNNYNLRILKYFLAESSGFPSFSN